MSEVKHVEWPKIPRLGKETVYISEKIDGTCAAINIQDGKVVAIQSRNTLIDSGKDGMKDNYGFAAWVRANEESLVRDLGEGLHFGEWWGPGINRGYGLRERKFSLFNTRHAGRVWETPNLDVVPLLRVTTLDTAVFTEELEKLRESGSIASPGFMRPEGIIIFLYETQRYYKYLLENPDQHKGQQKK